MPVSKRILYRVDGDDCIIHVGQGWQQFAFENGAVNLSPEQIFGKSLWDFITGKETQHLYGLILEKVRSQGSVLTVPFRCDSPILRRSMKLVISPLAARQVELASWTIREEDRASVCILDPATSHSGKHLTICSWCKRVELENRLWVEVEVVIERMGLFHADVLPQLSHGICSDCKTLVMNKLKKRRVI